MRARKTALAAAVTLALSLWQPPVCAQYTHELNSSYLLVIMQKGDTVESLLDESMDVVREDLNPDYLSSFVQNSDYWSSLFGRYLVNTSPARIQVTAYPEEDDNASAYSPYRSGAGACADLTALSAALFHNDFGDSGRDYTQTLAYIALDHASFASQGLDWNLETMTNLPSSGVQSDLTSTLVHEFAHALGLVAHTNKADDGSFSFEYAGNFVKGTRDANGNALTAGARIEAADSVPAGSNSFVVLDTYGNVSGAYFTGTNTAAVLNGAKIVWPNADGTVVVPGIPVNGFEFGTPEFAHLELKNGLLSHQFYRNYNVLMEAELAVLEDIGVPMDRRNLFGYSVYNSGENADARRVFVNTNPYYARTAGGEWIAGEPNTTPYGVGLHLYGSYNEVTQAADLLSSGMYGIGIRVDGEGNIVTVAPGTTVSADGTGGIGLLVAYGKGHEVNIEGTVTAKGSGGNAVAFNFGDNNLGNQNSYRGSYIQAMLNPDNTTKSEDDPYTSDTLLDELQGALVDNVNISGTLVGADNAVFVSRNAYVHNINILSGASISGDITSEWDYDSSLIYDGYQFSETGEPLLTNLNFGVTSDTTADPEFSFTYEGDISGGTSMIVNFRGGTTSLGLTAGTDVSALAVTVAAGATLCTSGTYTLNTLGSASVSDDSEFKAVSFGTLVNAGTLSVGGRSIGSLTLTSGDYRQTATGTLVLQYSAGATDTLTISSGSVMLEAGSTVSLQAAQDYYPEGFTRTVSLSGDFIVSDSLTSAATVTNDSSVLTQDSPTLLQTVTATADGTAGAVYTVSLRRVAGNTYSRFAPGDENAAAVGRVFDAMAADAPASLRPAVAAMDFSGSDGTGITAALDSLVPAAFSNAVNGILSHQTFLNDLGQDQVQKHLQENAGSTVYAEPYFTRGHRGSGIYKTGRQLDFGVVTGADRADGGNLYGVYLNLNTRTQKTKNKFRIRDNSLYAGMRGVLSLNESRSLRAFADARLGADFVEQDRQVRFSNYQEKTESDYTAFGAAAYGGLGYELPLSAFTINFAADFSLSYIRTPSISESGGAPSMDFRRSSFHSLKAGAGVSVQLPTRSLENGGALSLAGTVRYHRELLADAGRYGAAFRGAAGYGFTQTVDYQGRDSLYISADSTYRYRQMLFRAALGGEFYRGQGRGIFARLGLDWKF